MQFVDRKLALRGKLGEVNDRAFSGNNKALHEPIRKQAKE
jgi:hypothetical protein